MAWRSALPAVCVMPSSGRAPPAGTLMPSVTATIEATIADKITMANCQPCSFIMICATGTRANCPKDPKLVTSPIANERFSGGAARATAPTAIEMPALPSPIPIRICPKKMPDSVTTTAIDKSPTA